MMFSYIPRVDGVIYVAAKAYYFGVGGGSRAWLRACEEDGTFVCEVVRRVEDGKSNLREIIRMTHKKKETTTTTTATTTKTAEKFKMKKEKEKEKETTPNSKRRKNT